MTTNDYRDAVKRKYRITVSTLDTDIQKCVEDAVPLLAPYVKKTAVDTSLTATSETESLTIPTSGADLRKLMIDGHTFDSYFKDGDIVYLTDYPPAGAVKLFLRVPYEVADIEDIPFTYQTAMIELSCAQFATLLAGSKSAYNIYSQANGARSVDNMLDLAEWYEDRAERRLLKLGGSEALS